jgi:glutathione S-transferase
MPPTASAGASIFVAWFNRVWKVAPNAIADADQGTVPAHAGSLAVWAAELRGSRAVFEQLLAGGDHLLGDAFGIADVIAFPFLKYAASLEPGDPDVFHHVLHRELALDGAFPALAAWIRRVHARPRA